MKTPWFRFALLAMALFFSPAALGRASAQQVWQVTLIRVDAGGERICSNVSVTFSIPLNANGAIVGGICLAGVSARLEIAGTRATLTLTGASVAFAGCRWAITSPITGSGFISGNAVPATQIQGTASTNTSAICNSTVAVTGSFQALCVSGLCAVPPPQPPPQPPVPGPGPAPPPLPPSGNPNVGRFNGPVTITPPGGNPYLLTAGNQGTALPPGTRVAVGHAASVTLQFPTGSLALEKGTNFTVLAQRFFLLTPPFVPLQGSFMRITWRCVPGVEGCASIATPNTRLALLPPCDLRAGPCSVADGRATTDVAFTVEYSEASGSGSTIVALEQGTLEVEDYAGVRVRMSAGQKRTFAGAAAGADFLNLNGDTRGDVFAYHPTTGAWLQWPGIGTETTTGRWSAGWTVTPVDFNGDGLTDFHLNNTGATSWSHALNDGKGGFAVHGGSLQPDEHTHLLNLNGDRMTDVIVHTTGSGRIWAGLSINGGDDVRGLEGTWKVGFEPYPARLNDDEFADAVLFNARTGEWSWAVSNGYAQFSYPAAGTWSGATHIFPGDLNGDGRWDVLVYNATSGAWSVARNTGSGFTIQRSGTWTSQSTLVVGDFDADGDADVFVYDPGSGRWTLQVSEKSGDTERFTALTTGTWSPRWRVTTTNINGDGLADLFLYYADSGAWVQVLNTGLISGTRFFFLREGQWDRGLTVLSSQTLTQGTVPNDALVEPCGSEAELKSVEGVAQAFISFANTSSQSIRVYWLNYQGARVLYKTLDPGTAYVQETYRTHPWVVTDSAGNCQGIYLPPTAPSQALIPGKAVIR